MLSIRRPLHREAVRSQSQSHSHLPLNALTLNALAAADTLSLLSLYLHLSLHTRSSYPPAHSSFLSTWCAIISSSQCRLR